LTPLSTALSKRSKMLIVVLSSFPRAVRATYGVGGSEAAPSHSLAAARSGVAPSVGMFPMSKGLRARIEGPSWQGIPCHDAPVTFGAHVTRVMISVLEQTECGHVVVDLSVSPGRDPGSGCVHVGGIVSGCVLALRALPAVMQCTFEASDQSVDASGCFQVGDWEWDELVKK